MFEIKLTEVSPAMVERASITVVEADFLHGDISVPSSRFAKRFSRDLNGLVLMLSPVLRLALISFPLKLKASLCVIHTADFHFSWIFILKTFTNSLC